MNKSVNIINIINKFVFPVFIIIASIGLIYVVLTLTNMFMESFNQDDIANGSNLNLSQSTINKLTNLNTSNQNSINYTPSGSETNPFLN